MVVHPPYQLYVRLSLAGADLVVVRGGGVGRRLRPGFFLGGGRFMGNREPACLSGATGGGDVCRGGSSGYGAVCRGTNIGGGAVCRDTTIGGGAVWRCTTIGGGAVRPGIT